MVRRKIKSRRARTAAIDTTAISVDAVSVKNPYRVAAMLAPICEGDTIGDYLDVLKDGGAWAYEDSDATARYAACHGEKLRCFTVTGITRNEATAIAADYDVRNVRTVISFRKMLKRVRKSLVEQ